MCGVKKSLDEFNCNRGRSDGKQSRCKKCQIIANRQWANKHPETRRAALRRQYAREKIKLGYRQTKKASSLSHKAHHAVELALKRGALSRPTQCERCCQTRRVHAHHPDYSKPL